jgi:4-hydroxythreonine-4-phosphate dehydrogenase
LLALTLGDPAGVGPEVAVKALAGHQGASLARILAIGDSTGLAQAARLVGGVEVHPVDRPGEGWYRPGVVDLLATSATPGLVPGRTEAACGEAAYLAVVQAVELVQAGAAEAICTAPLAKASLNAAGHRFPGHTELLGHLTGVAEPVMMLAGPRLKVALDRKSTRLSSSHNSESRMPSSA